MFKKALLTVIVSLMMTTLSAFEAEQLNRVNLTNNTGSELWYVFISPGDSDWWGFDALVSEEGFKDKDVLRFDILYPDTENYFDIMAVDREGNTFSLFDILISDDEEANVTLDATMLDEDKDDLLFAQINIENTTDNELQYVFISSNESEMWGIDFLGTEQTLGAYETLSLLAPLVEGIITYDIMAIYDDDYEYSDSFDIDYDELDNDSAYTYSINSDNNDTYDDSVFDTSELNNITIINNTGIELAHVFISPSDSSIWGLDALGSERNFEVEDTLSFDMLYSDYENHFDIMAVDGDGNAFVILDQLISDGEEANVILDASLLDEEKNDMNFAEIEVVNPTENEILYVFISPSDSQSWGIDFMGIEQTLEANSTLSWAVPVGDEGSTYDIMVIDDEYNRYIDDFYIDSYELDKVNLYTYTIDQESSEGELEYNEVPSRPRGSRPRRGD